MELIISIGNKEDPIRTSLATQHFVIHHGLAVSQLGRITVRFISQTRKTFSTELDATILGHYVFGGLYCLASVL